MPPPTTSTSMSSSPVAACDRVVAESGESSSNPQVSDVGAAWYSTLFVGYDTGQQTPHLLHVHERRRPWLPNLRFSIYTVLAEEETPAVKLLTTCTLAGSSYRVPFTMRALWQYATTAKIRGVEQAPESQAAKNTLPTNLSYRVGRPDSLGAFAGARETGDAVLAPASRVR